MFMRLNEKCSLILSQFEVFNWDKPGHYSIHTTARRPHWPSKHLMDGDTDSGGEGNDELTCMRSDESDKSLWSAGIRSSLGSWFQRQGDAWRKERLLTFREEEEGGRERFTTSEDAPWIGQSLCSVIFLSWRR